MSFTTTNQRIRNPVSGVAFRLMADPDAWRITRSAPSGQAVSLTHLRGRTGDGQLQRNLIDRFLAGDRIDGQEAIAASQASFRLIALTDFTASSHSLSKTGVDVTRAYVNGRPGLRPRCQGLRKRFEEASRRLHQARIGLAMAWSEIFGQEDLTGLPSWMPVVWSEGTLPWDRQVALAIVDGPGHGRSRS